MMKTQSFKLTLHRETLKHLSPEVLARAGGALVRAVTATACTDDCRELSLITCARATCTPTSGVPSDIFGAVPRC